MTKYKSKAAKKMIEDYTNLLQEVHSKLIDYNAHYKQNVDAHQQQKMLNPSDLVMMRP